MRHFLQMAALLVCALRLPAQSNEPVRLALISISEESSAAADVLTAELSKNQNLQLLERNEIEKVWREQGFGAANRNYLQLGKILGADGLLLLEVSQGKCGSNLTSRLVAAKPGLVLTEGSIAWPLKDARQWAEAVAGYLNSYLPKLRIPVKDAIPISVVNLRFAIQSADSLELEKALTLLTIQRLSREPRLFVLERQQLQLLSEEKELKLDDSPFWRGSYLLEGVIDQSPRSKEILTVNARLTPPEHGVPLLIEVQGNRTNLAEIVNRLVEKVDSALKVSSSITEWSGADEAGQFFAEAGWALKWGVYRQAQAAAEAAWALGKRDMDCALVRIKAYTAEVPFDFWGNEQGSFEDTTTGNKRLEKYMRETLANNDGRVVFERWGNRMDYAIVRTMPEPAMLRRVLYGLRLYSAFSRTLPPGEPAVKTAWHDEGIEVLVAASRVLKHFHAFPQSQPPVADTLAEVRAEARSVAAWISQSPTVRSNYFVGNRIVTHDELGRTIGERTNLYLCKVEWGCFWQETPEDGVALYRELMGSPAFTYIHRFLWFREKAEPRLCAWTEADRKRAPETWQRFITELACSTNVLWQLEAKSIALADAVTDAEMEKAFTGLFDLLFANTNLMVTNNVELSDWGSDSMLWRDGRRPSLPDALEDKYRLEYRPRLEALNREFWDTAPKRLQEQRDQEQVQKQKDFLSANRPFDIFEFSRLFPAFQSYTKAQAEELLPLLAAYKSNLTAQLPGKTGLEWGAVKNAIGHAGFVEDRLKRAPNPWLLAASVASAARSNAARLETTPASRLPKSRETPAGPSPDVVSVERFLPIPEDRLLEAGSRDPISEVYLAEHHPYQDKLWLIVGYHRYHEKLSDDGFQSGWSEHSAAFVWNPPDGSWEVIRLPDATNPENQSPLEWTALHDGALYVSGWNYLRRYDLRTRQWRSLTVPWQKPTRLFSVGARLFAANDEAVFEILQKGQNFQVLASTRRRPVASRLDSLDNLAAPTVFAGPEQSIRVSLGSKVFAWETNDWRELFTIPDLQPAQVSGSTVLLRSLSERDEANLWVMDASQTAPELCLSDPTRPTLTSIYLHARKQRVKDRPRWKHLHGQYLASAAATVFRSNLYFLEDHFTLTNSPERWTVAEKDGCHAHLAWLSPDVPEPLSVPLKFDVRRATPPLAGLRHEMLMRGPALFSHAIEPTPWIEFTSNTLCLGAAYLPGVWIIPRSDIDAALGTARQSCLDRVAQEEQLREQRRKEFLAKYDLNHNGTLEAGEKEETLADLDFLRSELDLVDTNRNHRLDREELAYFDPNRNGTLDPSEEAGLEKVLALLAERLLDDFDEDGDGQLDANELGSVPPDDSRPAMPRGFPDFRSCDLNNDLKMSSTELELYLRQQTIRSLQGNSAGPPFFARTRPAADQAAVLKAAVENGWRPANSTTNRLRRPWAIPAQPPPPSLNTP